MAITDWSNQPIDLMTRRIDELEKRIKMLSTRVYDLESNREKSEEALYKERMKARAELAAASEGLLKAAQENIAMPILERAADYRAALKRCNDLGLGLSE